MAFYLKSVFALGVVNIVCLVSRTSVQANNCVGPEIKYEVVSTNHCSNTACVRLKAQFLVSDDMSSRYICWDFGDGSTDCYTMERDPMSWFVHPVCHEFAMDKFHSIMVVGSSTNCNGSTSLLIPSNEHDITAGTCADSLNGCIQLNNMGANASFLWSNGQTTQNLCPVLPGMYQVTVYESDNCDTVMAFKVDPLPFSIETDRFVCGSDSVLIDMSDAVDTLPGEPNYYSEDFNTYPDGEIIGTGPFWWESSTDHPSDKSEILDGRFHIRSSYGKAYWSSQCIDISSCHDPILTINKTGRSDHNSDYIEVYTRTDGGPQNLLFRQEGSSTLDNISDTLDNGNCVEIIIQSQQFDPFSWIGINSIVVGCTDMVRNDFTFLWCNGATTEDIEGVPVSSPCGLTVTDNFGCTSEHVVSCCDLEVTRDVIPASCQGICDGVIQMNATTGTPPYSYIWSNMQTTDSIFGLCFGIYEVTITDGNGCLAIESIDLVGTPTMSVETEPLHPPCVTDQYGSLSLHVYGGGSPYSFLWNDGHTESAADSLAPGTYYVTVTDSVGCSYVAVDSVLTTTTISLLDSVMHSSCKNPNGVACAKTVGGNFPYRYLWSNGMSSQCIGNLDTGTYHVTVTDGFGCTASRSYIIQEAPPLVINVVQQDTLLCVDTCIGSASVIASNGVPPYQYSWSNTMWPYTTPSVGALCPGYYEAYVKDSRGCLAKVPIRIFGSSIQSSLNAPDSTCSGQAVQFKNESTGKIASCLLDLGDGNFIEDCGDVSYTYEVEGSYPVQFCVTDSLGCSRCLMDTVDVAPSPSVCFEQSGTGCAPLSVMFQNCSVGGDSVFWNFGDGSWSNENNPLHEFQSPGCYDVTLSITSASGCTNSETKACVVEAGSTPLVDFEADQYTTSIFNPVVQFTNKAIGGQHISWDFGDGVSDTTLHPIHMYNQPGMYDVLLVVCDQLGCCDSIVKQVIIEEDISFYLPNSFTPNNDGVNDIFQPQGVMFCDFVLTIFDRWGNNIFEGSTNQGWDGSANSGSIAQQDVYVYVLTNHCGEDIVGHISLLR